MTPYISRRGCAGQVPCGGPTTYDEIVALLAYAGGNEQPVRITTTDRTEVLGVPTSVDTHITAHEVFLRPLGQDDTEIAVSLGAITTVELA